MTLRPYQQRLVDASIDWMLKSVEPFVAEAATGAGKSHIIADIAEKIHARTGKRVLCLAPSAELVTQNRSKFTATGAKASTFSASAGTKDLRYPVVFGSPLTVKNKISRFMRQGSEGYALVIVDECHGITPTVQGIIASMREGNSNLRVMGLTATPYRLGSGYIYREEPDGRIHGEDRARDPYFAKCVERVEARELIEQGYLTPPVIGQINSEGYDTSGLTLNSRGQFDAAAVDRAYHGHGRKTATIVADVIKQSRERRGVMFFAATVQPALLHLEIDGARHDVARGQFGALVMLRHEALARQRARRRRQLEQGSFTAQSLADEEGFGIRVIQAGRVELDEFHVRHPAACAPGHGDAVAGGRIGVGGVQVDLAGPTRGQHRAPGCNGQHSAAGGVLHVHAQAARLGLGVELAGVDQVDGAVMFQQGDVGMGADALFQRHLNRVAGGIGGVDDAALAVAAFAGEVIAQLGAVVTGEGHALGDQPFDGLAAMFDDIARGALIAQAGTGDQGVADMLGVAVAGIEHGSNAALRPIAGPVQQLALGNDHHLVLLCQMEGHGKTGQTAAEDGDITLHDREQSCCCGGRR